MSQAVLWGRTRGRAGKKSGARGRTRTGTLLRAVDFESTASTNSATRAMHSPRSCLPAGGSVAGFLQMAQGFLIGHRRCCRRAVGSPGRPAGKGGEYTESEPASKKHLRGQQRVGRMAASAGRIRCRMENTGMHLVRATVALPAGRPVWDPVTGASLWLTKAAQRRVSSGRGYRLNARGRGSSRDQGGVLLPCAPHAAQRLLL